MTIIHIAGKNIKAFREKLSLTQDDVARYLGIDRSNVSYWENGTRLIPPAYLSKLADLFMVDEYDLLEEGASMTAVNISFCFKGKQEDLHTIGLFNKIVKNYLKMKSLNK